MPTSSGHTKAIRASRVIGTNVYNNGGDKIGEIEDVMLDKTTDGIMFAVVGFGGFLGIGEKYHAVPWKLLDFDESTGGYVVPFTKEQLEQAPAHGITELTENDGLQVRDMIILVLQGRYAGLKALHHGSRPSSDGLFSVLIHNSSSWGFSLSCSFAIQWPAQRYAMLAAQCSLKGKCPMTAIVDIIGREILDSRGNPTVEVDVILEDGSRAVQRFPRAPPPVRTKQSNS